MQQHGGLARRHFKFAFHLANLDVFLSPDIF